MPQEIYRQGNFNGGELDPRIGGRQDLKVYFACLDRAENVVALPVGPIVRRPGTAFIDYARHQLEEVTYTAAQVGAPVGGTAADILDPDAALFTTTTDLGDADQVLVTFNFGEAVEIHLIDLIDFGAKADPGGGPTPDPVEPPFTYPWPNGNFDPGTGGIFGAFIP